MIFWLDHVHECVQLLFESSLWCFCCLFCFPDPHSPCLMCQKPKWVPRVFRRQMWVLSDSFSFWSSSSFQQTWCQITLEHELAEVSSALCFCARLKLVIWFLRAERLRRLLPDSKMDVWCPYTSPGPHPNGFLLCSRAPAQTDWERLAVSLG